MSDPYTRTLAFALTLPGAWEDHPWGDTVVKVGKKIFLFAGRHEAGGFGTSTKLPHSMVEALTLPNTRPTGYGLGKAGWVSARFEEGAEVPEAMLRDWILESYRAVAPKKLIKELDSDTV